MSYPRSLPPLYESRASRMHREYVFPELRTTEPGHFAFSYQLEDEQHRQTTNNATSHDRTTTRQFEYFTGNDFQSRPFHPSHFPNQYRQPPTLMDENMNPISYDDANQFFSSKNPMSMEEIRSEICADFVREHFKCPVCLDVMIEATSVTCGHKFCRTCIETWLTRKLICPVCEKKVTVYMKEYDVDNAIDSVAYHLSDEWKARRIIVEMSRPVQSSRTPWISYPSYDITLFTRKAEKCISRGLKYLKNAFIYLMAYSIMAFEWLLQNTSLEGLAKGVWISCTLVVLVFFSDEILNFTQYIYYVMSTYQRGVPVHKQIAAMANRKVPAEVSKYQEFFGLPDTIFAKFISSFYKLL